MEQSFPTTELKLELERALGFELRELIRLDGAGALNFKAVWRADGFPFAVKCLPSARREVFDRLVANARALAGSKAVPLLFEPAFPRDFRGFGLACFAWCDGERVFPDRLTDGQFAAFLDDYLDFSAAMQKCPNVSGPPDCATFYRHALGTRGFQGINALARWFLRRAFDESSLAYREELLRVIHSDLHHGNFLFRDGRVSGYLDFEGFRKGYPAEDLIRYLVCAKEHLRWYDVVRTRRILDRFESAVRRLPYSDDEWRSAIDMRFFAKAVGKLVNGRGTPLAIANLLLRAVFYRRLKERIVRARR